MFELQEAVWLYSLCITSIALFFNFLFIIPTLAFAFYKKYWILILSIIIGSQICSNPDIIVPKVISKKYLKYFQNNKIIEKSKNVHRADKKIMNISNFT